MDPSPELGWVDPYCAALRLALDLGRIGQLAVIEPSSSGVVVKDFSVAAPIENGVELALNFLGTEMFVQDVAEKIFSDRMVALGMQRVFDKAQDGHVS